MRLFPAQAGQSARPGADTGVKRLKNGQTKDHAAAVQPLCEEFFLDRAGRSW
jgi:hypothetical protein